MKNGCLKTGMWVRFGAHEACFRADLHCCGDTLVVKFNSKSAQYLEEEPDLEVSYDMLLLETSDVIVAQPQECTVTKQFREWLIKAGYSESGLLALTVKV